MKTRTYLLIMLAGIVIPMACLSCFGLYWLLQSERETRLRSFKEMANSTSLMVDGEIAAAEASLKVVANSSELRADDFAALHRMLSATSTNSLTWTLIADVDGSGLMNTLVPYGAPLAKNTGKWAGDIYRGQKTSVSGYFIGAKSGRGVVSVNVPVPTSAGKPYVVTQIFDPRYFNTVFARSELGKGWVIGLFDANGIAMARNINAEKFVGTQVRPSVVEASRKQLRGVVRDSTIEGVDVYYIFVRSKASGWTTAIGVPVDEVEASVRNTTFYAALALAVVLGAATLFAVFFGRLVDKSMRSATRAAAAIGQGSVPAISHTRLKEVNTLLEVLHRTSAELKQESQLRGVLEQERQNLLESERAARLQAEAQSDAKDHFISMLSHELRNPLAAIVSAISVVRLPRATAQQQEKAWAIVERQFGRLSQMLDELLDVRRVLSGKVALQMAPVNLGELVQFCCDSKMVGDTGTHEWEISTVEAWVLGDRTRLGQIIDNLLSNAIKFTPDGGSIAVSCSIAGGMVQVKVRDTGMGIAPEVLPTIFDSLVQGPTTIDRSQGGLGLGLSIAKGLATMHGGTIDVTSAGAGTGSTFVLTVPSSHPC